MNQLFFCADCGGSELEIYSVENETDGWEGTAIFCQECGSTHTIFEDPDGEL